MYGDSQQAPEQMAPPVDASAPGSPPEMAQAAGETTDPTTGRKPVAFGDDKALLTGLYDYGRRNKALVEALGLPKDAETQDALRVIEQLQQRTQLASRGPDDYELPPEIREREQLLLERSWNAAGRDFGEEFVQSTQGLRELVLSTNDPYELVSALHQMMAQVSSAQSQGQQAPPPVQQQLPPAQASQQPRGVDMEVARPGWIATPDDTDKPGTGDTRGFFQRVFGQAR
jgi:hypothetical protein